MAKLKEKLGREKPWALLGLSRREYEARRPWAAAGQPRERFENLLRALGQEPGMIQQLREYAEAEALVEMIFGEDVLK
jgi:hypothetical protein